MVEIAGYLSGAVAAAGDPPLLFTCFLAGLFAGFAKTIWRPLGIAIAVSIVVALGIHVAVNVSGYNLFHEAPSLQFLPQRITAAIFIAAITFGVVRLGRKLRSR